MEKRNDDEIQARLKGAQANVLAASLGSCTCKTKTPEMQYHDAECRYRLLSQALDSLEVVADHLAKTGVYRS